MPKALFLVSDQILWEQRIHKESINAKARNDFSLRNAVSVEGVPKKFKPGHLDPSNPSYQATAFDPAVLGWDPKGPVAQEFRRCMTLQVAGPRERHQFPETCQQEHGWIQGISSGSVRDRSEPAGSNPTKLGIGWLQKDGHGGVLASAHCKTPDVSSIMEAERTPKPRRSREGNVREELGAPPFATSVPLARFPGSRAALPASEVVGATARGGGASPASRSQSSSLASAGTKRCQSTPTLHGAAALRPETFLNGEASMDRAMDQSRRFLNRHRDNEWYHPLSNSDVATFADSFTKCWGRQLYGKTK